MCFSEVELLSIYNFVNNSIFTNMKKSEIKNDNSQQYLCGEMLVATHIILTQKKNSDEKNKEIREFLSIARKIHLQLVTGKLKKYIPHSLTEEFGGLDNC
jgi:hypothetical protein